jgi:hypothetical protein
MDQVLPQTFQIEIHYNYNPSSPPCFPAPRFHARKGSCGKEFLGIEIQDFASHVLPFMATANAVGEAFMHRTSKTAL